MCDNRLYAGGIRSVLVARWLLVCRTPLVVRNGKTVRYREKNQYRKERGGNLCFEWEPWSEVSDAYALAGLCYRYQVVGDTLHLVHQVPASAVRGVLRSWMVRHLVSRGYRSCLTPPSKDDAEEASVHAEQVARGLEDASTGLPLLASLFGTALDTADEETPRSNAGRLWVQTEPFAGAPGRPIEANGTVTEGCAGPGNARRHVKPRNPLDRMTHASIKGSGGLHRFLEFAEGESFAVNLTIRNPAPADVGLLSAWVREIDAGLLRLGALAAIGRGRMEIHEPTYSLWWRAPGVPDEALWPGLVDGEEAEEDEPLAGLYRAYRLPAEALATYEPRVMEEMVHGAQPADSGAQAKPV